MRTTDWKKINQEQKGFRRGKKGEDRGSEEREGMTEGAEEGGSDGADRRWEEWKGWK